MCYVLYRVSYPIDTATYGAAVHMNGIEYKPQKELKYVDIYYCCSILLYRQHTNDEGSRRRRRGCGA
jgi:hypothetical protein